ncbi:MAG: flagellar biosynthesis anti-sigma factor FlgM [Lachnospiraceae bacterium]|nr:flagellar biosynthesis anti-sigma factor FlgM [Lachnospiraceae bacterium]
MRIDAYNQIASVYNATKPVKVKGTDKVSGAKDEFKLSSAGKDYQIAKQAVAEASDIREDKVADVKQRIDSGNYQVDTGDFASMLLAKFNSNL